MSQESEEPKPREIHHRSRYDSFKHFDAKFKTERDCREAFEKALWPDGVICPHCGGLRAWRFRDGPKKSYRPGLRTHLDDLMRAAIGRRLHYTRASGLRHADEPFRPDGDDDPPPKSTRKRRAIMQAGREGEF